jgi:acetoin utilization deacetylase AcuC-like enzyme
MSDEIYLQHWTGIGHPESPLRLAAIVDRLRESGLWTALRRIPARQAQPEDILAVHRESYIQAVKRDIEQGYSTLSTGDTAICKDSLTAAMWAVGGVLAAGDAVMSRQVRRAFCAVRPPGHHAASDCGMGFCIFNNVAALARYLQRKHGLGRVLIVDWDVHHGNGTQEIFYEDDSVLFFSTHQWPLYPGTGLRKETGAGEGRGFTINCPLPSGAGDEEILAEFDQHLLPAAGKFEPEFVIISSGFDSRTQDPLGDLNVTDEGFAQLTRRVVAIANESAAGRVVSVLEGGYNPLGLGLAVEAHIRELGD